MTGSRDRIRGGAARSRLLLGLGAACVFLVALPLAAGEILVRASPSAVGDAPAELNASNVSFRSASGAELKGWLARGVPDSGAVLLMHGVRADRRMMLDRARFLHRAGYTVLLFDFQAHGESTGDRITYGMRESEDARAALALLRAEAPASKVAIIGASLGGAAALLARPRLEVDALVLEAVFPTIEQATVNRMRAHLGRAAGPLAPALLWQLRPRLGLDPSQLHPIDRIVDAAAPVFVIAGDADRYTPIEESRELFDRARGLKEFWAVPGADHVDLHAYAPREYEANVLRFLRQHLRGRSTVGVYESPDDTRCGPPRRERITLHPDGRFEIESPICTSPGELAALRALGAPIVVRDSQAVERTTGWYEKRQSLLFIVHDGADTIPRRHGTSSTEGRLRGDSLFWPSTSAREPARLLFRVR